MPLVRMLGATDSLILSELMDRSPEDGSEFYATGESIGSQFGFTAKRVQVGISRLVDDGLITQTFRGLPRRAYYVVNIDAIQYKIAEQEGKKVDCKKSKKRTTGRAKNGLLEVQKTDCINNISNSNKSNSTISKINKAVDAEKSASVPSDFDHETIIQETEPTPLNSKKEKPNQGGGRLHQEMVEAWDEHLQERFQTSVSGLSKLGKVGANMKALQRIREFLHDHATKSGHSNPDAATLADFKLILKHKHNAGQFFDRADLTHLAKFLPDIIRLIQPKNQNQDKNNPYKIISDEQLADSLRQYFGKYYPNGNK